MQAVYMNAVVYDGKEGDYKLNSRLLKWALRSYESVSSSASLPAYSPSIEAAPKRRTVQYFYNKECKGVNLRFSEDVQSDMKHDRWNIFFC